MIKLLIADVDGTLTDESQRISPEALDAIRRIRALNVKVGLASALPYCALKYLALYFGCDQIVIAEGGGVIDVNGKMMILGDPKVPEEALEIIKRRLEGQVREKWSNMCRLVDRSLERDVEVETLRNLVEGLGVEIVDTKYAYHIVPSGVNKGRALRRILELLNIRREEVAVAGDSMGDYELFLEAGVRIAPANAPPELKEMADYVSPHFGGRGFADGVNWLVKRFLLDTL